MRHLALTTPSGWKETWRLLRSDKARLVAHFHETGLPVAWPGLSPSFLCVLLYRLSRFCFCNGHTLLARCIWQCNVWLTGADISPLSNIGEGLLIVHPVAVTIVGTAGPGFTIEGLGGLGGGLLMDDIGAGPGLPMLGENVCLQRGAMVLGPVKIGDRVTIGAGCTVTRNVPDDSQVLPHRIRVRERPAAG